MTCERGNRWRARGGRDGLDGLLCCGLRSPHWKWQEVDWFAARQLQKPRGPQNANMHNYLAAAAAVFGLCKIRWSPTMNINARAIEKQSAAVLAARVRYLWLVNQSLTSKIFWLVDQSKPSWPVKEIWDDIHIFIIFREIYEALWWALFPKISKILKQCASYVWNNY